MPLKDFLGLRLDPWVKDVLVVIFFFFNRFLSDFAYLQLRTLFVPDQPISNYSVTFFRFAQKKPRFQRTLRTFAYFIKFIETVGASVSEFYQKHEVFIRFILVNGLTFFVVLLFAILLPEAGAPDLFQPNDPPAMKVAVFMVALYAFPLLTGLGPILLYLSSHLKFSLQYTIWIIRRSLISSYKTVENPPPKFETFHSKLEFNLFITQLKFSFNVTLYLLLIIGLNYQYPKLFSFLPQ